MAIKYKELCRRCKKNYVAVTGKQRYPICYECHKSELEGEIKDPKMKKMFDIPEEFYEKNLFLRDIKIKYLEYRNLSEKQVEAFKKTVKKMKEAAK
ncbi:MAG: hypothetical protein KKA65_04240 [Nanoarchaeota archaeon]|nr:hypothetical protein [Nanoarchaeota archaeon]MBU4241633.1 hypothetical protein [Nanoarchaeota archaeon]MBU4351864.1 hypothetical protein [Nanoarchaeota archaeon]MBU4456686.1 hypothetical protein [Nanoarchaeota archaeon]MCG2719575.1 hypothetical protein [Nanoarchaeota archaeon]